MVFIEPDEAYLLKDPFEVDSFSSYLSLCSKCLRGPAKRRWFVHFPLLILEVQFAFSRTFSDAALELCLVFITNAYSSPVEQK